MDNLSYVYTGNQLNYVNEGTGGDANAGFINGNTGTDDYAYDGNGNLSRDKNKGAYSAQSLPLFRRKPYHLFRDKVYHLLHKNIGVSGVI